MFNPLSPPPINTTTDAPPFAEWQLRVCNSRWIWCVGGCLLLLFALSHSFTSFARYDDESYVMMTMKTAQDGHRLYGETYSQYGPAFYLLQVPIHQWLNIPITHDVVRIKTVLCWLLVSCLIGLLVARVTGQSVVGVLATLLVLIHLDKLGLEPAHPQEWIALASATAMLLIGSRNVALLALAGCCAAVAGMIKLNSGAILAMPLLLAAVSQWTDRNRLWHIAAGLLSAACLVLPVSMMLILTKLLLQGQNDGQGNPVTFRNLFWPAMLTLAAIGVMARMWANSAQSPQADAQEPVPCFAGSGDRYSLRNARKERRWVGGLAIAIGGMLTTAVIVAWTLSTGTSLHEMWWGVVGQHSVMVRSFYVPVIPNPLEFVLAAGFGLVSLEGLKLSRSDSDKGKWLIVVPLALAIAISLLVIDCWQPLEHGAKPRGASRFLALAGSMLMPCVLIRKITPARLTIALSGCLGPLLAFPVAGTQLSLGTVATLAGLIIATDDARRIAIAPRSFALVVLKNGLSVAVVAALVATTFFASRWLTNEPLDQPGCRWVRLEPEWARLERGLAAAIRRVPSEHLAYDYHNPNRFFFWTNKRPMTAISPTCWPLMLNGQQQNRIAQSLEAAGNVCVVKVPGNKSNLKKYAPAIEKELFRDWELLEDIGPWQVGLRHGHRSIHEQSP